MLVLNVLLLHQDTTDGRWRAVGTLYPTGGQPTKVVWVENENPVEAL